MLTALAGTAKQAFFSSTSMAAIHTRAVFGSGGSDGGCSGCCRRPAGTLFPRRRLIQLAAFDACDRGGRCHPATARRRTRPSGCSPANETHQEHSASRNSSPHVQALVLLPQTVVLHSAEHTPSNERSQLQRFGWLRGSASRRICRHCGC